MPEATDNANKPEFVTRFDKFILRVVGTLLVAGIIGIAATMFTMNINIVKMEINLRYLSEKIEEGNKDRYTLNMAIADKSILNSRIDLQNTVSDESNRKISVLFKKVTIIEKDIIKINK